MFPHSLFYFIFSAVFLCFVAMTGWELLASISPVFKPSIELFPCVYQFVYERCFDQNEIGGLAVHTLRQLMAKRNSNNIQTPSARHQANLVSRKDLSVISATPLTNNVFGSSIVQVLALEKFVQEVHDYRNAVKDLQKLSKDLHNDPALHTGSDTIPLDGSDVFGAITEDDIDLVTLGSVLDIKSTDDKKYRTRYCWVRALFSQHIMCYVVILTRSILVLFLEFILILILIFILVLALLLLLHFLLHYFFYLLIFSCRYLKH